MSAVDRVEELAKGERHLTREESRYWCFRYLQMCRELAIELDAVRTQIYAMQYQKNPAEVELPVVIEKMTQSEKMKEYWRKKKLSKS